VAGRTELHARNPARRTHRPGLRWRGAGQRGAWAHDGGVASAPRHGPSRPPPPRWSRGLPRPPDHALPACAGDHRPRPTDGGVVSAHSPPRPRYCADLGAPSSRWSRSQPGPPMPTAPTARGSGSTMPGACVTPCPTSGRLNGWLPSRTRPSTRPTTNRSSSIARRTGWRRRRHSNA
jgi:hypothetical protein